MVELVEVKFQTKLPQHLPTNRRLTKYVHLKMATSSPTQYSVTCWFDLWTFVQSRNSAAACLVWWSPLLQLRTAFSEIPITLQQGVTQDIIYNSYNVQFSKVHWLWWSCEETGAIFVFFFKLTQVLLRTLMAFNWIPIVLGKAILHPHFISSVSCSLFHSMIYL